MVNFVLKEGERPKMAPSVTNHKGEHVSMAAQCRMKALHNGWMTLTDDDPVSQHKNEGDAVCRCQTSSKCHHEEQIKR